MRTRTRQRVAPEGAFELPGMPLEVCEHRAVYARAMAAPTGPGPAPVMTFFMYQRE
jgi:hypothetical protein